MSESEDVQSKQLDTTKLPWEIDELTSPSQLAPTLRETQALLRLFAEDRQAIKTSILMAARHPELPDSEWDNIICGRAMDLNKVLSNMVTLGGDTKHIKHIAGLRLQVGSSAPVHKIQTLGDWTLAWGKASAAITFPHRCSKLQAYSDHITELFRAINPIYHNRIILYNQSIRARASCQQDVLLSDLSCFEDLCTMHITLIGVGISVSNYKPNPPSANSARRLPAKISKLCRWFNLGKCPNSTKNCRYQHICSSCHQLRHVEAKCMKTANSH